MSKITSGKKNPLSLIQLPNDAVSTGYKQTRPFHFEQVFSSESKGFKGTELEFLNAGLAYEYTQTDRFTRVVLV
jgi:hypothetical protein